MALAPLAMSAVNTIIHTASYDLSKITIGTDTLGGVTYNTVHYDGLYNDGAPGMPSLPVDYIRFSVPWNATNFTVSAALQNNVIGSLNNLLLYPCQPYRFMDDTTHHPITLPDSSVYYSNSYYPAQNAWVVDEGFLAGENHIITVAVMPVSYMHSKTGNISINNLKKSQTVRLTISYELRDSLAMYPIVRQDTELRREGYRLAQSMVVNPNNVAYNAPIDVTLDSLGMIIPSGGDGLNGGGNVGDIPPISTDTTSVHGGQVGIFKNIGYLIVTTADLYHSTRRIAALKRQDGYDVSVVTMEDVLNSPYSLDGDRIEQEDGSYKLTYTDNAGKLRQYLKYMFKMGTQYVFLVGDSVPYRYMIFQRYPNEPIDTIPTDLYFSELNGDWSDSLTMYKDRAPELYIGRLLASSPQQVQNNLDKLLRYEINPGKGDRTYLQQAFFLEGRDFITNGFLNVVRDSLNLFYPNPICISDSIETSNPLKGNDVVNLISTNHVGFLSIFNHGGSKSIMVYGKQKNTHHNYYIYADTSSGAGLNSIRNKFYPMVFYAPSCNTIPFDRQNGMNFGESFTTGKDYGGPVYIGYTRDVNSVHIVSIFNQFTGELRNAHYKVGDAVALSKYLATTSPSSAFHVYAFYESLAQGYLGDPSLELWTGMPLDYTNISITRGNGSITVSGIGVDSTTVSICGNSTADISLAKRNYLTNSSITISNISPNCLVMLHKHNMIPYIAPLVLQKVDLNRSQYVIASDVTAGNSVDTGRTSGDVTVKSGIEYEIEASGTVILEGGFNVERGATFAVYPSCF